MSLALRKQEEHINMKGYEKKGFQNGADQLHTLSNPKISTATQCCSFDFYINIGMLQLTRVIEIRL